MNLVSQPQPSDNTTTIEEAKRAFLGGAPDAPASLKREAQPWDGLDPYARPTKALTVRLNAWQHAVLLEASKRKRVSMSALLIQGGEKIASKLCKPHGES